MVVLALLVVGMHDHVADGVVHGAGAQNPVLAQSGSLDVSYSPTRTDDLQESREKVSRSITSVR